MPPRRVLHDKFFKQAKADGYLARSAYKLAEINDRKRLLHKGSRALDLGCAPGAWLQVASEIVGPTGVVVGIDLKPVEHAIAPNVHTLVGDIYETPAESLLQHTGGHPFDAVLSDMAPNTTGHGDHFLSVRLCDRVLDLLESSAAAGAPLLKPGGSLAMKVFEGEAYPDLVKRTARLFTEAKGFKPKASRDVSREMYIVAFGWKG
ncbi:MAG: RlmE family RNA methyltransferase [Phycisphaerales bacterium]|nr:RlmE family RNA methyltransferase [Phycisphaerales bacterium]